MDYAEKHAQFLEKLNEKGVAASFVTVVEGAYNDRTDTNDTPTRVVVDVLAVEIPGDPEEYEQFDLITKDPVTLIIAPVNIGELPKRDSTIVWATKKRTVKQLFPFRPVGQAIAAKVIVT